jgi:signal transduction histidine kinase
VGVAITAITHLQAMQNKSRQLFDNRTLKRSELDAFYQECAESSGIVERNLFRTTELIKTFKQLAIDQHSQDARPLNLCAYVCEVLLSLKPRLKRTRHNFCIDIDPDMQIISNPGAISQLLINLIMNSAVHAFPQQPNGKILIKARKVQTEDQQQELLLEYRDNGKGMTPHVIENIYKPFFTSNRNGGGSGLGMHICYNIVVKVLRGRIDCESEPGKGVHFTLRFPLVDCCPAELS